MGFDLQASDERFLQQIGARLARLRIEHELTQAQLATEAGLGISTIQRLESGAAATQLSSFLRVCRVLGLIHRLDQFLPERGPSPMEQLRQAGRIRKRVRAKSKPKPQAWTWGK